MRLIDADKLKAAGREQCKTCKINGSKQCKNWCIVNDVCDLLDSAPTATGIINAQDFRNRINNLEYVYLQACADDVLDAIDCEVTYFKEKMNNGKK